MSDNWAAGDAYDAYMGRWSRPLARAFVGWMTPAPGGHWLDVGCGTGSLTGTIAKVADPSSVLGCDPSESFVDYARRATEDARLDFVVGDTETLPTRSGGFDFVVSGLMLNFLPDPAKAVAQMRRRLRRGGTLAAYVWNYGPDGLEFLRAFWDEAVALDPAAAEADEARRFPLCRPEALRALFTAAALDDVFGTALVIPTPFSDFDDLWAPFLEGTGPAPAYVASLAPEQRDLLKARLEKRLTGAGRGRIQLKARAWAIRGIAHRDGA